MATHVQSSIVERSGIAIGRITLDRPEKKNALTPEMLDEVAAAVERMTSSSPSSGDPRVGAIVLDGNGAAFCAGFDLTLCRESSDALAVLLAGLSRVVRVLRRCGAGKSGGGGVGGGVPVIGAVHGAALAGGCALLGGMDYVISHTDAKIGYPVVRLGISPAVSASFLRMAIGDGRTRERMLDSTLVSGWDAARMGLVHECLEDAGKVRERAMVFAEQIALKPRPAIAATKALLNELDGSNRDDPADAALNTSLGLVGSAEERARLAHLWKN